MEEELSVEGDYQVVFTGLPVHGTDIKPVRENFKRKFKLSSERMRAIFNGGPVLLQKNLDWSKAKKYSAAMKEMGAVCEINRGQEATGDEIGLAPCPECKSLQIGDNCSDCGFNIKSYRSQMATKGFVEVPDAGYIKNRRRDSRRASTDRREDVRYEEKRRSGPDRRKKDSGWYSE
ncbi:MAG: hypothetical protein ACC641_06535 [Acidiferrobacterales bacterium]